MDVLLLFFVEEKKIGNDKEERLLDDVVSILP